MYMNSDEFDLDNRILRIHAPSPQQFPEEYEEYLKREKGEEGGDDEKQRVVIIEI